MSTLLDESPASPPPTVASRRIAEQLKSAILDGEFRPGSRILQEELAVRFGASRLPVREALRTLQSEGLITIRANHGAWVTRLTMAECLEIYRIRERLEPMLIADSMQHLAPADLDVILRLGGELDGAQTMAQYLRYDREFHLESYRASRFGTSTRSWSAYGTSRTITAAPTRDSSTNRARAGFSTRSIVSSRMRSRATTSTMPRSSSRPISAERE